MPVSRRSIFHSMVFVTGFSLLACAVTTDGIAGGYALLTAEEYAERTPQPLKRSLNRLANEGPEIIVHMPQKSGTLSSPLDFVIEFQPREAEPDLTTLKLEYDLGFFWKDVTDRLSDHAEISGNRLVSRGAELPEGDHHLRMSISDVAGKMTATEFAFTVAAN